MPKEAKPSREEILALQEQGWVEDLIRAEAEGAKEIVRKSNLRRLESLVLARTKFVC